MEETRFVIKQIVQKKAAQTPSGVETGADEGSGAPASAAGGGLAVDRRSVATRADAYRQLALAASVLKELEPHSPIPYLVQRAVELGALPFPELIKALIRDANVLTELNRELGIKPPE
jgi:type VI secretion system protein ImpA